MAWSYTESGNNTATSSWAVSHPAASAGDLLIFNVGWDDSTNTTGLTAPSGPNGETAITIENVVASSSTSVRGKVVYYIATGSWSASTLTFTPSASEQWSAVVIKVPVAEFDTAAPLGAHNNLASSTTGNPSLPSLTAGSTDGGGTVVGFTVGDTDDADGTVSGWTSRASTDRGAVGVDLVTRDTTATNNESISSASGWTYPVARDWVSFIYIVRPNVAPTVALNSPSDTGTTSDTTPDLTFTGTDNESNDIRYNIQVDTVNTFNSQSPTYTFGLETLEGGSSPFSFTSIGTAWGLATATVDSTSKVYGTKSLAFGATGEGGAYALTTLEADSSELYIGFAIYLPNGWTVGSANFVHLFVLRTNTDVDVFDIQIENSGAGLEREICLWNETTATWTQTGINLATGQINTIQVRFKQATSDGYVQLWVNNFTEGSPTYNSGSINTGGTAFRKVCFGLGYVMNAANTFYEDNFALNTSFMSSLTAGAYIDKVSGTDAGFSGSPDNSDPFTSAQAVTYTVQSALSNGTYYWRVRGIDPSGSNTYGAWSSTRSFTVSAATNYSGTPGNASLALTAQTPTATVSDNKAITLASPSSLTLTAQTPTVSLGEVLTPNTASLTTSLQTPTATATDNKSITLATPAALTTSLWAPTVTATDNIAITLDVASLTLTAQTPTATVTNDQDVTPGTASLTLTAQSPSASLSDNKDAVPGTASLTLTAQTPTVALSDNKTATPDIATLTLSPQTPLVKLDNRVTPGVLNLTTVLQTPTADLSDNKFATPDTASLSITAQIPTLALSDNKSITLTTAELILSTFSIGVAVTDSTTLTPGTTSLTLSPQTPTTTLNQIFTPGVASLSLTAYEPTVNVDSGSIELTPGTATLSLSRSYPIINGEVPTKKYYIDSSGNVYWVINQQLGLVEKV